MKGTPLKIFIAVLLTGLIGITGGIILKYDIDQLSKTYKDAMTEGITNQKSMMEISSLLYEHELILSKYIMSEEDKQRQEYEEREQQIREELKTSFSAFGTRLKGSETETLYHKVYSDYNRYLANADVILQLSKNNNKAAASHYFNNTMSNFLQNVNNDMNSLKDEIDQVILAAREQMDYYIRFSRYCEIMCIIGIIISTTICTTYCVKIATDMGQQETDLKRAMDVQHNTLMAHVGHLMDMQDNIILGMANLIENRDGDTGEHIKRTSQYVGMLAKRAREEGLYSDILTDEYIELLIKAAPMHDIGKISVPDRILQKPGRLTDEEFEQMKRHAPEGGRIVKEVLQDVEDEKYIEIASEVAGCHHEKWDGNGYSQGLSGDNIPLSARIMALADVFDALVSKRCYKDAMSYDQAFKIIEESAGSHFDPQLAGVFLGMKEEIIELLSE